MPELKCECDVCAPRSVISDDTNSEIYLREVIATITPLIRVMLDNGLSEYDIVRRLVKAD